MASIRDTKKDIKNITFEIASSCYAIMEDFPEKDLSEIEKLVDELLDVEEDCLKKLNERDKQAGKKYNSVYIKSVKDEFVEKSNAILDKMDNKIVEIQKI